MFSVAASTSTGVTNYQWLLNNAPIPGATGATYSVANVQTTNYGNYSVVVNDGTYPVSSAVVSLTPPAGPVINIQPASRAAVVGSSPSFTVLASTSSGVTNYQWMYYGTNLTGATAATLTLTNVAASRFGGPFTVRVNDGWFSVTSTPPAVLTLATSPTIGAAPMRIGESFVLSFGTEVGPLYVVDYTSSLTNTAWTPLSTNAGTGGILVITNTVTGAEGYFRVRMQ